MNMKIFCVILIIMTKVSLVVVTPTDAFYDPDGKIVFIFLVHLHTHIFINNVLRLVLLS